LLVTNGKQSTEEYQVLGCDCRASFEQALDSRLEGHLSWSEGGGIDKITCSLQKPDPGVFRPLTMHLQELAAVKIIVFYK
jgi:hypothetical protein